MSFDDPFGNDDPFGGPGNSNDPFVNNPSDDPFGGEPSNDRFADNPSNDNPAPQQSDNINRFGNPADDDPFGGAQDPEPQKAPDNGTFLINIKSVNGDSNSFEVTKDMKLKDLVEKYRKINGVDSRAKVILTYQGKILKEDKKIGDCDIDPDETLHCLVRLVGGF